MKKTIHPDGRVEFDGTPEEIREASRTPAAPLHVGPPMGSTFIAPGVAAGLPNLGPVWVGTVKPTLSALNAAAANPSGFMFQS